MSHVGGWMQTMAEAWLVLTLTNNGAAVGATFAFRFLPVAVFGLWGGTIADRFDRRHLLIITQSLAAVLAIGLWLIVWQGQVAVWMVYALGVSLGFVIVVDEPARHAFVEEMVGPERVTNAVALTSAVGNSARITGPAIAGLLIGRVGVEWVFFANGISFIAVVIALFAMDTKVLQKPKRETQCPLVREGVRYAWQIHPIRPTIILVAVVGTLVYNFPTFLSLMAQETFNGDASLAGFLMALLGVGTVLGALFAAQRRTPTTRTTIVAAAMLGTSMLIAVSVPGRLWFEAMLVPVGVLAVFFGSSANAHLQALSAPEYRGRVMAIYTSLTLGTTVVGGPLVGWICQTWTPRTGIATAGVATLAAAIALYPRAAQSTARAAVVVD